MKKCPFCVEEIQEEAIKCRYCGEWIEEKPEHEEKEFVIAEEEIEATDNVEEEVKIEKEEKKRGIKGIKLKTEWGGIKYVNEKGERVTINGEKIEPQKTNHRIRFTRIVLSPKKYFPKALQNPTRVKRVFLISWLYGLIYLEAELLREGSGIFDFFLYWPIQCIFASIVNGLLIVYLSALILKLISSLFKGKGTFEQARIITLSSIMPMAMLLFIVTILLRQGLWQKVFWLAIIPYFFLIIWHYYMLGFGVKNLYKFSLLKTILTIILTWWITGTASILIFTYFNSIFFPSS